MSNKYTIRVEIPEENFSNVSVRYVDGREFRRVKVPLTESEVRELASQLPENEDCPLDEDGIHHCFNDRCECGWVVPSPTPDKIEPLEKYTASNMASHGTKEHRRKINEIINAVNEIRGL